MNDPLLPTSPSTPPPAPPTAVPAGPPVASAAQHRTDRAHAPTDPHGVVPARPATHGRVADARTARLVAGLAAMALVVGIGGTLLVTGAGRDATPVADTSIAADAPARPTPTTAPKEDLGSILSDPEHLDEKVGEPGTWGEIFQSLPGGDDPSTDLNKLGQILSSKDSWVDLATDPSARKELGQILDHARENLDEAVNDASDQLQGAVDQARERARN